MYAFFLFLGWAATAALSISLWRQYYPAYSVLPGVGIGVVAGFIWPITLWIAIGIALYVRRQPPGLDKHREVQLSQVRAFAKQAEIEGMPASAAYWQGEAQRLATARRAAANPINRAPTAAIVAACVVGSLVSFSIVGADTEDVAPAGRREAAPIDQFAAPTTTTTTTTTAPRTTRALPPPTSTSARVGEQVNVARIVDGDTVELDDGRTVRLLGIDTPEVRGGTDCWGPEASQFARDILFGESVRLIRDPTQDRVDQYGRTLAHLVLPGNRDYSVLAAAAGAGIAYTYDEPVRLAPQIEAAEAEARAAGRGVWGAPCFGPEGSSPAPEPPEPETQREPPAAAAEPGGSCEPGYDPCVPPYPPDVNCGDLDDGPYDVTGDDPHGLDGDDDGEGCESHG